MKKILFASTALVATAGVAAAEISFGGSANFGVKYDGSDTTIYNEIDFDIKGSGETDGGLKFGASLDLDGSFSNGADTQGETTSPEVYVEMGGLKVTVGTLDPANDNEGVPDLGFDGIGVDDVAEVSGNGTANLLINYSFGDIAVAASFEQDTAVDDQDWAVGASGSFGDISVAAGYGQVDGDDEYNIHVGYSAGAMGFGVQYSDDGTETAYGLHGSYTQGDLTVTAVYSKNDTTDADAYGIGASYSLGGGAAIAGAIGEVGGETVADLGMTFSF